MGKAYWVGVYHPVSNPDALAAYAKLAATAIEAGGGRFLARGNAVKCYEAGLTQRVVIIEFDDIARAIRHTRILMSNGFTSLKALTRG
jgi:uncharacterized protein (DUF1330 family)